MRTLCYVSHRYRFIWILVAKNASSTLREWFAHEPCAATLHVHADLPADIRRNYFTFVFLRDPVERALSAYQEVSYRADRNPSYLPAPAFLQRPAGQERFEAFLDEAARCPWDGHVHPQARFIKGVRIDDWGCVEHLQRDVTRILGPLGIVRVPDLPRRRSRASRAVDEGYTSHHLEQQDLAEATVRRIRDVYHDDVALYQRYVLDAEIFREASPACPRDRGGSAALHPRPDSNHGRASSSRRDPIVQ
ncbi:MAG: sulfotransferase family 2 domain-containing protein [Vicinamibacterales bacterium]